jgi:hypothetical protein
LQLVQRVLDVVLHGAVRQHEPLGNLLVRQPFRHQPQHLGLALGKARRVRARLVGVARRRRQPGQPAVLAEDQSGQTRREHRLVGGGPPDSVEQLRT